MTVHDVVQRSPEWHALHLGRFTASRADDMLAMKIPPEFTPTGKPSKAKAEELAGRRNLRAQMVLERITDRSQDRGFVSNAMQDGIDREEDALAHYEAQADRPVFPVGFVTHDELMAGASPDGVIGEYEGLVEAKCPLVATHFEYLRTGRVPTNYYRQVLHQLWITGAQWCDWVSFHPDFPAVARLKVVRVMRNEDEIADYEAKARTFLAEVDREVEAFRTQYHLQAVMEAVVAEAAV